MSKFFPFLHSWLDGAYNIGIIEDFSVASIPESGHCVIHWIDLNGYTGGWFADPFILEVTDSMLSIMVEEFRYDEGIGRISLIKVCRDDYTLQSVETILRRPFHLSFPYLIRQGDSTYFCPESNEVHEVSLYLAVPHGEKVATLIREALLDTQIVEHNGEYYAFSVGMEGADLTNTRDVRIYRSDSLFGPFCLSGHILKEKNEGRGAGDIFMEDGHIYRPSQLCERGYGKGIIINELFFSGHQVSEKEVKRLLPIETRKNGLALHNLSVSGKVAVVDGFDYKWRWLGRLAPHLYNVKRWFMDLTARHDNVTVSMDDMQTIDTKSDKKRVLFVIETLGVGGAERSLVSLLNAIDYDKYDVELQLFERGGKLEGLLPSQVRLLPLLPYAVATPKSLGDTLMKSPVKFSLARLRYSAFVHCMHTDAVSQARLYWQSVQGCFSKNPAHYDVAVAYGQGVSTFYVVDCVDASRRYGWVNAMYSLSGRDLQYQHRYYQQLDSVVCVSDRVRDLMSSMMPDLAHKCTVIHDLQCYDMICRMAKETPTLPIDTNVPVLVTVARLVQYVKGYDLLLEAARILRDRGYAYHWYIIGDGEYRGDMERYIADHGLGENISLVGTVLNPYPFVSRAQIYVQASRHEGYGLSIAEARMLNVPIVTTAYEGWEAQMVPDCNGLVVDLDPSAIADGVIRLMRDPQLRQSISDYQATEPKGNLEELSKVEHLLDL